MRTIVSGVAAFALVTASATVAFGAPGAMNMGATPSHYSMPMCSAAMGPVVWWVASTKMYYLKGSSMYGKGKGMYACRATAVARGGHPGKAMAGSGMSHGSGAMGAGSNSGGSSSGGMGSGGMSSGGAMPMSTTAPMGGMRSPMPATTGGGSMGSGSSASITPAPAAPLGGQAPTGSGNMGNSSGNQGNTGAPGAGGQTPNQPGTPSNNASPKPRPT